MATYEKVRTPESVWYELQALREMLESRHKAEQRALDTQAREYERRLSELNHAYQQAQERNAEYLPRESHAQDMRALHLRLDNISRLVYMGVGILLAFQTGFAIFVLITRHS